MNLIGNSCVSAFISKLCLKEPYGNPFCWAKLDFDSIYALITKYDSLDYNNVEFIKTENYYTAVIDNCVKVQYIHYLEDPNTPKLTFEKANVKCKDILPYVKEKYFARVAKMQADNKEPIFILAAGYWQEYYLSDEQIQKIIDADPKYKIIVCMPVSEKNRLTSQGNVRIHNHTYKMGVDGVHKKIAIYLASYFFGTKVSATDQISNLS